MLDIFKGDAFSLRTLTDTLLKRPYQPGRIGSLGLFRGKGISTTTVTIEEKDGRLALIPVSPRGGPARTLGANKRRVRAFVVPHLEKESVIYAEEVQNVRAFGSENNLEGVQAVVNERLTELRQDHEVTLEHMRVGAIKGQVLDADGQTVLLDLFDEFDVAQTTHEINFGSVEDVRNEAVAIQRKSEAVLGAETVSGYRAFCGDEFFDAMLANEDVKANLQALGSPELRNDLRQGFIYGGITWENYRGKVGDVQFFPEDEAYVVPQGTGIFAVYFAPADFMETVNTIGLPGYAKIVGDPELNRWAKVHTQSNPLVLNLRPDAVVRVTMGT